MAGDYTRILIWQTTTLSHNDTKDTIILLNNYRRSKSLIWHLRVSVVVLVAQRWLYPVMSNDIKELHPLILQLANADQRESALLELSKKREAFPDLAPVLWHSFGTIAALLQEIISIYPMLSPPTLSPHASNRVCNALALLQCVASHPETKSKLMNGTISPSNFTLGTKP